MGDRVYESLSSPLTNTLSIFVLTVHKSSVFKDEATIIGLFKRKIVCCS